MSEHQITLSEKTYQTLLTVAQQQGVTPADWIASQLARTVSEQPLSDLISDLIGAIDSQSEAYPRTEKTSFGEGIATKLAQQGLQRP